MKSYCEIILCVLICLESLLCFADEEWPIPEQDKIPVVGYFVSKARIWVPHLNGADCMDGSCVMNLNKELHVEVSFIAVLSSISLEEHVDTVVANLKSVNNKSAEVGKTDVVGRITKVVNGNVAVVDVDEMALGTSLIRMRSRMLRVRDGVATVSVSTETKYWKKYEVLIQQVLNGTRVMSVSECTAVGNRSCVAVDAEGDMFVPLGMPMMDYERHCMESARDYFCNDKKNRPAISLKERKAEEKARAEKNRRERILSYRIASLCGYRLGAELEPDAKYVKTGAGYEVRMPIRIKKPFDVCSSVVLKYTERSRLLYSICIESKPKTKPLVEKMNVRVAEMAKALENKYGDKVRLVEKDGWYTAEYKQDAEQMLYCGVKKESVSFKNLSGANNSAKFVVVLEDSDIRLNGYRAECVREDR